MDIGFIGLGIMGRPMSINLLKGGHNVYISSSNDDTNDELAHYGAVVMNGYEAVAEKSDFIILMLPDSSEVKEVVVESGLFEKFNPGTTVIDMSSINPVTSREVYEVLSSRGHQYIDAPVSGGEEKAIEGTLSIMAGGDQDIIGKVMPILECMGAGIVHTGPVGSGNAVKLVNQVIVANNIAALSEGLALAEALDLDLDTVYDAISGGLAGSAVMDTKFRKMASGEYEPGFKMKLHMKDLNNAFGSVDAETIERLPVTQQTKAMMMELMGNPSVQEEDHSALYRLYKEKG